MAGSDFYKQTWHLKMWTTSKIFFSIDLKQKKLKTLCKEPCVRAGKNNCGKFVNQQSVLQKTQLQNWKNKNKFQYYWFKFVVQKYSNARKQELFIKQNHPNLSKNIDITPWRPKIILLKPTSPVTATAQATIPTIRWPENNDRKRYVQKPQIRGEF